MRKIRIIALSFLVLLGTSMVEEARAEVDTFACIFTPIDTLIIESRDVLCNLDSNGRAWVTIVGGVGPFGYDWGTVSASQGNGTDSIFNLLPGFYTVEVIDSSDGTSCFATIEVGDMPPLVAPPLVPPSPTTSCDGLCDGTAGIVPFGGTGPGTYTYEWPQSSSAADTFQVAVFLCAGINWVIVTDSNGCTDSNFTTVGSPLPVLANVSAIPISCSGAVDDTIFSLPSGGTGAFTHSWSTGSTNDTLFNQGPGTYVDTVRDANLCVGIDSVTITDPLPLTLAMDSASESCGGACDGTATAIPGGGDGSYTYSWNDGGSQTNATATGLCIGMYIVTVSDGGGCTIIDSIEVPAPVPLTLTIDTVSIDCNGNATGSLTANAGGGTGAYTYQWDVAAGSQTTATATGLIAGIYCITVTDSLGCTISDCDTLADPPLLVASAVGTNVLCFGNCDGTGTATPTGGTPPYTYLWDDPAMQTTAIATGLCATNTFCVTITDANNCTDTACVNIAEPPLLTLSMSSTDEACNGACDGTGTATPSGGFGAYTYIWNDPGSQTNATATGLCAGTWTVTVEDANGCTLIDSVTLIAPPILTVTATFTEALCGMCDGSAEAFPVGGTGSYTYLWTPPPPPVQNTKFASGLCSGPYQVLVTDSVGCQDSTTVTLTPPTVLTLTVDSTLISCFGSCDGTATANPAGGSGIYTYLWDDPSAQTTQTATGLCPGTWCVTVTDSAGCTISGCVDFVDPPLLTVTVGKTDITCNGLCNGSATATPGGGTGAYTYLWDDPAAQTNATTGLVLCAGAINVTVSDTNGCTATAGETIIEPSLILPNITITPSTCGNSDGAACLAPSGGTPCGGPPFYNVIWPFIPAFTSCTPPQPAGVYNFTISDCAIGCSVSGVAFISDVASHTVVMSDTDVVCNGACDGIGEGVVSGGVLPYTYQWMDALGVPIPLEISSVILNRCPGKYILEIEDNIGCVIYDSVFITEPAVLLANVTSTDVLCSGDTNGTASISPSGGTLPYTYTWGTGATTTTIINLSPGWYDVTLTDANGCQVIDSSEVQAQAILNISTDTIHVLCNGDATGSGIAIPSGGVAAYTYQWDLATGGQTDDTASSLIAGFYDVTLTDANACTNTATVEVQEPAALTLGLTNSNASCFGASDGDATATVGGGFGTYTYVWDDAQTTSVATALAAGPICVTVTDGNGCTVNGCITVMQPIVLSVVMSVNSNISCNGLSDGGGTATPAGGTTPYTYLWDNPDADDTSYADTLTAGTWHVTITDNNGCSLVDSITITEPNILALIMDSTDLKCNGVDSGIAGVHTTGGTTPYTFAWDASAFNQTDSFATGLSAGIYVVTVTDINGCQEIDSVNLDEPSAIAPNFTTSDATCNVCDGGAKSVPTGGTPPYSFDWYDAVPPATIDSVVTQCAGLWSLELTDSNNCIDTFTVGINNLGAPIIDSVDSSGVSCFGTCDGGATVYVQAGSGTGAFTYTWSTSASTTDVAADLCVGTEVVQVADAINCIVTEDIIITGPTQIISLITGTNILCFGACDGTADVTPSGGVGPYTYLWWPDGETTPSISGKCADTVACQITDNTGCIISDTLLLTEPPIFDVTLVDSTNISCFGVCDGIITVTSVGGTKPYTYEWDDPSAQTDSVATGLCVGTYKVTVTDNQGCSDSVTVTLSEPADLTSSITDSTNITCFGLCNGSATITPVGGTAPYAYAWNNPGLSTDSVATAMCADSIYGVAIEDANGCRDTTYVTLSQPALLTAIITDSNNISCNGLCDGDATVTAAGGSGTYTYLWDNTGPDNTALGDSLCAGTLYHVTVSDSLGCTAMDSITLTAPLALSASITDSTNISCNGLCDGMAVGLATGGTSPYTYTWSPSGTINDTVTGLCASTIDTLIVTDTMLCSDTVMVTLSEPGVLVVTIIDSVNASCFGVCDGIARTTTVGGTPNYTYSWNLSSDTLDSAITLCADTMNIVMVTDSNGCTAQDSVMLSQPFEIFATIIDSTDATCFSYWDGKGELTGTGGTAPLTYLWHSGETGTLADSLCADSTLWGVVLDSLGCTDTAFFTISQPTEIVITFIDSSGALCDGGCEGNATISVTGGTPPYNIVWSNGDSTVIADSLCAGTTTVTVTDSIGCFSSDSITIIAPTPFVVDTLSTTTASCDSLCDAMAVVFGTGGNTPYTFIWVDSVTVNDTALNLCASTFTVMGIDSNGCTYLDTVVITGPVGLTISVDTLTDVSCAGACDGAATVSGAGGVGSYTFSWVDTSLAPNGTFGGSGTTETGLCAGVYFAVIEDGNGCIATVPVIIAEPVPLSANVCDTNIVTCNAACDGSATACPIGGTSPFSYQWSTLPIQTDSTATGLCAGIYDLTVTDAKGCIALDSLIVIAEPTLLSCVFFDTINAGCGSDSASGSIEVVGNGGTLPYNYQWNTIPVNSTDSAGGLLAGTYGVTVTDGNGCQSICSVSITDTSDMAAFISDSGMVSCNGSCDGFAVVTATGSTQPYSYNWIDSDSLSINQPINSAFGLCAGLYRGIIKSASACFRSVPIQITEPDTLVAMITDTLLPLCNTDSNGQLVVSATGGTSPYTYAWYDTSGSQIDTVDTIRLIPAGQYRVFVVDSNGCLDSVDVILGEPSQLAVTFIDTVQPTCSNTCDGIVVAGANGGTAPYAYLWLPDSIVNDSLIGACVDTFIIAATDSNGCVASDTISLTPSIGVNADAGLDQQICEGDTLTFIADTLGATFEWYMDTIIPANILSSNDTFITTPILTGSHEYILIVNDSICSDTDSVAIYIVPVAVEACCDQTIAKGECIDLIGTVTNGVIYSWDPGISLSDSMIANPNACPEVNTTYTLTATNDSGCTSTDTVRILVEPDVPDGFTPQGDGFNDVWEIALLNNHPDAEVQVYNRWGQLVFDSPKGDQYAVKFDGTFEGKDLPVGTYYFVINLNDGVTDPITGPITIMR